MPFDECKHGHDGGGGGGHEHRKPTDGFVQATMQGVVLSARLREFCVACSMWAVGKELVSTHIALTLRAMEHHLKREMTADEITETVGEAVQEICDAFSNKFDEMEKAKHKPKEGKTDD